MENSSECSWVSVLIASFILMDLFVHCVFFSFLVSIRKSFVQELNFFLTRTKYYIITFGSLVLCTGLFQVQQVLFYLNKYKLLEYAIKCGVFICIFRALWKLQKYSFKWLLHAPVTRLSYSFFAAAGKLSFIPMTFRMMCTVCPGISLMKKGNSQSIWWYFVHKSHTILHRTNPSIARWNCSSLYEIFFFLILIIIWIIFQPSTFRSFGKLALFWPCFRVSKLTILHDVKLRARISSEKVGQAHFIWSIWF